MVCMRTNKATQDSAKSKLDCWWKLDYEQAINQGYEKFKVDDSSELQ